jgi:mannose-6-phosphate isomerase-like protein (cupin superfamily)
MTRHHLSEYRDWFVGDFEPTLHRTKDFEVGIKRYKAGETALPHYHVAVTEFTIIVEGSVRVNGEIYKKDEIVRIEPGEAAMFESLSDSTTVVVKFPSIPSDKIYV